MNKPITITGAGPAGLTAAINLVRAGYEVAVYEKRADTGKRFHGDIQGLENWSDPDLDVLDAFKSMNLQINFDCDPCLKMEITNGQQSRISHYESPLCYLVKRGAFPGSLDHGLKQQALEAGVRIHFNQTIPLESADIVATGPISKETFAVDKGIIFQTDYEDTNIFLVNDEAAYKGYAYLLITRGYGCLCTVLFDHFTALDACYDKSLQIFRDLVPFNIEQPRPVAGVGCFSTRNVFQSGSARFVGEAAGLQDLMWGFGIRTAVESGYLAAQSIIQAQDYAQMAQNHFQPKLKATLVSRFIWEMIRIKNYAVVVDSRFNRQVQKSFDLSFFYNFNVLQKTLYPLAVAFMKKRYTNLRI